MRQRDGRLDGRADERTVRRDAAERSSDAAFSRQRAATGALPVGSPHSVGGCRSRARRPDGGPRDGLASVDEGRASRSAAAGAPGGGREGDTTGALHFAYVLHPFLSQDGRKDGAGLQLKKKRASTIGGAAAMARARRANSRCVCLAPP